MLLISKLIEQKYLSFLVNKQINDKERIAAAMENPNLREIVETCIKEEDWCVWGQYVKFKFKMSGLL